MNGISHRAGGARYWFYRVTSKGSRPVLDCCLITPAPDVVALSASLRRKFAACDGEPRSAHNDEALTSTLPLAWPDTQR